jgi:hypothetical protein
VGKVKNERIDIVTRAESTPEKKVRLQRANQHNYTSEKKKREHQTKGMKSENPLTVTQYPVRDM